MSEPTIDEAIEQLRKAIIWTTSTNEYRPAYQLAIKALEEMRDRHALPEKPRTWRDVTAGEMWDTCNDEGSQGFIKGSAEAHLWFHSVRTTDHWRSMGA